MLEAARPLADGDPECVDVVLDRLEREGVVIRTGVNVLGVTHAGAQSRRPSRLRVPSRRSPAVTS